MDHTWIAISVFAALMQAVRTAAQKTLNQRMSNLATTYVRSLFGLPIMVVYLAAVLVVERSGLPSLSTAYLGATFLGALAQVLATMLLIYMFKLKNFAVGTMLTKVDIVMTAVLGSLLFSERLSLLGFVALLVVLAGVILMSLGKSGLGGFKSWQSVGAALTDRPTVVALGCAFLFTLSYLFLREATLLAGPGSSMWRGAWTVALAVAMQTVGVGVWLWLKEPQAFQSIRPNLGIITFIGTTSAFGSIGWFTAFAMQNASYVRAVGQIEVVFTLLISALYFRESIKPLEYWGIAATVAGVVMFRIVS
ncbi:MAG: EamA family transporter [Hyphomicrobiaceae bacterium]